MTIDNIVTLLSFEQYPFVFAIAEHSSHFMWLAHDRFLSPCTIQICVQPLYKHLPRSKQAIDWYVRQLFVFWNLHRFFNCLFTIHSSWRPCPTERPFAFVSQIVTVLTVEHLRDVFDIAHMPCFLVYHVLTLLQVGVSCFINSVAHVTWGERLHHCLWLRSQQLSGDQ